AAAQAGRLCTRIHAAGGRHDHGRPLAHQEPDARDRVRLSQDENQARCARHRQALRNADLPGSREAAAPLLRDTSPMRRRDAARRGGIVKWSGVRFSDFANMVGMQRFASYGRLIGSDGYYIDEDMATLMHPQVVLAWLLNDEPIPSQHGAPLRLIVPFRYGARSLNAITDIQFTAPTFPPPKPCPTRAARLAFN